MAGIMYFLMGDNKIAKRIGTWYSLRQMKRQIKDADLQSILTPDYPIGAKRILFSDHYYAALTRTNVHVVTDPIAKFSEHGIITTAAKNYRLDVVIFATGFITNPFLKDIDLIGRDNEKLHDIWKNGAEAYLGMTVAGFPNFYMMYGPNTNLGHNSIIIMSEAQADYITQCLLAKETNAWSSIEVKKETQKAYNEEIQQRLQAMAWNQLSQSWYRIDGKITNNWPGRTMEYTRRTNKVKWSDYWIS
jgi:cation diffusion facilitator CzcD-associated flavoprotein CzcO